jgi:16S rRNA (cytosine1402-N4)-methyltransferase
MSEGLQVSASSYHVPVMEREIIDLLKAQPQGVVIDATLGGAGHAVALLGAAPHLRVLGLDRDPEARAEATKRLAPFGDRARVVATTFADLAAVVKAEQAFINGDPIVGILFDLGVSSHQLDSGERGFSFRADAPLDMRMDPTRGQTAAELLVSIDTHELGHLLRENGETRFAGAIAKSLKEVLPTTTNELVSAVERAVPMAARRRGNVATRAFQALRLAVNDEPGQLDAALPAALDVIAPTGVIVVISYHSGEDRVVKQFFAHEARGGCTCPAHLPCVCGATPRVTVRKASAEMATEEEIARNPRSRSARLRVARKVVP